MKSKIALKFILYIFSIFLFIEILSFLFTLSREDMSHPNYNFLQRTHYLDINSLYGSWHLPNTTFRHKKSCFDVIYKFNSIGARDKEFDQNGLNRIFLLGDSYAEGYGNNFEDTFDNFLEKKTGFEVLNFATSGYFGTTQERILYEYFQDKYEHDIVLQIITVANDFEDDSYDFNMKYKPTMNRYRPYLIKNNESYKLIYHGFLQDQSQNILTQIKKFLSNFTYTYNLAKYLKSIVTTKEKLVNSKTSKNYYIEYDQEIFDIFKYNFDLINKIAKKNNRSYVIVLVPDFYHLKQNLDVKTTKLNKELSKFSNENEIIFLDIQEEIKNYQIDIQKLFYTNDLNECDAHINEYGNKIISNFISDKISLYLKK